MKDLKYEYVLTTWGGLYNSEYDNEHNESSGRHYFNTKEERDVYLDKLEILAKKLNTIVASNIEEGFTVKHDLVTLHRVTEWEGKQYYTKDEIHFNCSYSGAVYLLNNKWYPGCNDYPLGEEFDYDNNEVITVQEWITGSFTPTESDQLEAINLLGWYDK